METSQTADYALLALLELEHAGGQNITELAASLGVNRTVAQRVLSTLHARGFVVRDLGGRYRLGPALVAIASGLPDELAVATDDVLRALSREVRETVVLAVRDGDEAVIVAREAGSSSPLRVEYEVGFRQSLSRGASSLAILAFLDDPSLKQHRDAAGEDTLARIRKQRYARTEGQIRRDMVGLAAPIRDSDGALLGSLAIVVPAARADRLDECIPRLHAAAEAAGAAHDAYANSPGERTGSR